MTMRINNNLGISIQNLKANKQQNINITKTNNVENKEISKSANIGFSSIGRAQVLQDKIDTLSEQKAEEIIKILTNKKFLTKTINSGFTNKEYLKLKTELSDSQTRSRVVPKLRDYIAEKECELRKKGPKKSTQKALEKARQTRTVLDKLSFGATKFNSQQDKLNNTSKLSFKGWIPHQEFKEVAKGHWSCEEEFDKFIEPYLTDDRTYYKIIGEIANKSEIEPSTLFKQNDYSNQDSIYCAYPLDRKEPYLYEVTVPVKYIWPKGPSFFGPCPAIEQQGQEEPKPITDRDLAIKKIKSYTNIEKAIDDYPSHNSKMLHPFKTQEELVKFDSLVYADDFTEPSSDDDYEQHFREIDKINVQLKEQHEIYQNYIDKNLLFKEAYQYRDNEGREIDRLKQAGKKEAEIKLKHANFKEYNNQIIERSSNTTIGVDGDEDGIEVKTSTTKGRKITEHIPNPYAAPLATIDVIREKVHIDNAEDKLDQEFGNRLRVASASIDVKNALHNRDITPTELIELCRKKVLEDRNY